MSQASSCVRPFLPQGQDEPHRTPPAYLRNCKPKGELGVKRFAISLLSVFAVAVLWSTAAVAQPNLTGQWVVEQTGPNGTGTSTITITQTGNTIVGKNPKTGTGFSGSYCQQGVDKG